MASLTDIVSALQNGVVASNKFAKQLTGSLNNIAAQFAAIKSAWTAYTPIITALSGTFTTVSATGRYLQNGKTVFVSISITITTNGTAAVGVVATLPSITRGGLSYIMCGRENAISGKMVQGITAQLTNTIAIVNYDNSYPGGTGANIFLTGIYEAA